MLQTTVNKNFPSTVKFDLPNNEFIILGENINKHNGELAERLGLHFLRSGFDNYQAYEFLNKYFGANDTQIKN